MTFPSRALLCAALLFHVAAAGAAEFVTVAGSFDLPDGFRLIDRNEDEVPGQPRGALYVFMREADDLPRGVFMVSLIPGEEFDTDHGAAAAIMADPTDPGRDADDSEPAQIGGAAGSVSEATGANGLETTVHVADYVDGPQDYRMLVFVKHPPTREYRRDRKRFEEAIAAFRWAPQAPAADVPAAGEEAQRTDLTNLDFLRTPAGD